MGIFDFFKSKKTSQPVWGIGSYFDSVVNEEELRMLISQAITVFEENTGSDSNQILKKIKFLSPDENLTVALYRFIPIAYCRLFIPEVKYSDEYVIYKTGIEKKSFLFSKDKIYNIVFEESRKIFNQTFSQEQLLSVLNHSSEFNAINDALSKGSTLQNLFFTPVYFL
jgi:hypothetical protein